MYEVELKDTAYVALILTSPSLLAFFFYQPRGLTDRGLAV
jgi:hypothetical protein